MQEKEAILLSSAGQREYFKFIIQKPEQSFERVHVHVLLAPREPVKTGVCH